MKQLLNIALLVAFLICYLEWPPHHSMFIFQAEYEIFSKTKSLIDNLTHPIILTGLIAQLLLLIAALKNNFNKKLNTLGVLLLGIVVLFFFFVGIFSVNLKISISTLPFLAFATLYFVKFRKK